MKYISRIIYFLVLFGVIGAVIYYIFSYTKVNQGIKFYGENHINIIYPTTEESKKYIDVILRSFEDKRTQNFIKWYVGNGAISKSEMETILPIFLDEEEVELVFEE